MELVVLVGEEQGRDVGGRRGVRGCSIGDEGGDAAVVGENGSIVAVAVLKAVTKSGWGADCCTGKDTVFVLVSVFLFVVVEEGIVFKRQKERRDSKREREMSGVMASNYQVL